MILHKYLKNYYKNNSKAFARKIGTNPSYVSQMARGHRRIERAMAKKIEEASDGIVSRLECLYPEEYQEQYQEE